jgi:cytochrome oxidase assembly protein ShyY1
MASRLQAPPWAVFAAVAVCTAFVALGIWQLQRGNAQRAMQARTAGASLAEPLEFTGAGAPPAPGSAVRAQGRYEAERQLLLDGQEHGEESGYDVWTPLRLAGGGLLVVNRGWIPAGRDRRSLPPLPAPPGAVSPRGVWHELPRPGIRLGGAQCQPAATWPRVMVYPTAADLQCAYGEPVANGELLLAPDQPGGFVRQWSADAGGISPARHFAYAVQWFAFAVVALVLLVKLNLRQVP